MDRPTVAVVLAGGQGTRLYPASRPDRPKQFLALGGDRSLLARTVERARFADEVYVLTRPDYVDAVRERVPNAAILAEPEPKDTGPALVYATHRIRDQRGDCTILALPSDHYIEGDFTSTARTAARVARETDGLVTVGVKATRAATEYGYVAPGERRDGYFAVEEFVEKPDQPIAERYVEQGYYWNAGLFAWTADAFLRAARASRLRGLVDSLEDETPAEAFDTVDPVSVDTAVLETADDVLVVPAGFEWDDLGSWDAVGRVLEADADGNVSLGETLAIDANDCVLASDGHLSAVGVDDLVIASFDGRTVVVPREDSQRVRDVISRL